MVWRRSPYENEIELSVGQPFEGPAHPEFPGVIFRAKTFKLSDGTCAVSVFLENAQEGQDAGDEAWLFQGAWRSKRNPAGRVS